MDSAGSRLHVLNGDAARVQLEQSTVPGTFSVWADVLHDGPCLLVPSDQWRRLRSRHLASRGFGRETEILEQYERADAQLDRSAEYEEVVFWFEHDLFDQLLLIRHLHWLSPAVRELTAPDMAAVDARAPLGASGRKTVFSLICIGEFPGVPDFVGLGQLTPPQLASLLGRRHAITAAERDLGARSWAAFCSQEPHPLVALLAEDTSALPFLDGALRRLLAEYPAADNGLSRSERQILEAVASGASMPVEAFRATARMEERPFIGDASWWILATGLASAHHPLLAIETNATYAALPDGQMRLTDTGREVLAGRADHVTLNGIDRWLGGVHLTHGRWRWNGSTVT